MKYKTYPPSKKLEKYVRFFWVLESDALLHPYIYRSMADSCTEIIFHYKNRFDEYTSENRRLTSFRSGIHGPSTKFQRFITDEAFGIFGVYLYPYAVKRLLNLSPGELTNAMPDLHSVLGKQGRILEEQILAARNNRHRCQILTDFFERKLLCNPPDDHPVVSAVRHVISTKQIKPVREFADQFNLSERQFERKFKEYAGVSPKLCMRIVRFSEACNHYKPAKDPRLTDIALSCGYYDQSHFIREFKEFSGYEPGTFFSGEAEGIEWREV